MAKNLYKVASDLNESILADMRLQLRKAAASKKEKAKEAENKAKEEKARFRTMRNLNRGTENAIGTARIIAATAVGGLLGGLPGAFTGGGLSAGAELLGGAIGRGAAYFQGGRDPSAAAAEDRKLPLLNWKLMLVPGYGEYRRAARKMQVQNNLEDIGRFMDKRSEMTYTR